MTTDPVHLALLEAFDAAIPVAVLDSLALLCTQITPDDLASKWEAYMIDKDRLAMSLASKPQIPTLEHVGMLGASNPRILGRAAVKAKVLNNYKSNSVNRAGMNSHGNNFLGSNNNSSNTPRNYHDSTPAKAAWADMSSPRFGASALSSPPFRSPHVSILGGNTTIMQSQQLPSPAHAIAYAARSTRLLVQDIFNPHIPSTKPDANLTSSAQVSLIPGQQTEGYRYMYEKLTEKGDLLNDRIDYFARLLARDHLNRGFKLDASQLDPTLATEEDLIAACTSPLQPHQETHFYAGRVCCDSILEGTRMNAQSLILETSREIGTGQRVKLNLAPYISTGASPTLFPGQIIGVDATNPSGLSLNVSMIHYPPELAYPITTSGELKTYYKDADRTTNIVVCAGPYTLEDSLGYEPLEDLAKAIEMDAPDVVIMMGPFIDVEHIFIVDGLVDCTVSDLFREKIVPRLRRILCARPALKLILVPSIRDACMEWVAFPQPPICAGLDDSERRDRLVELGLANIDNLFLFPNPVQFQVNELVVGVSTLDVLLEMNAEQVMTGPSGGVDRISMQFEHILQQRSFYPLFPPASNSNLDTARALATPGPAHVDVRLDLLIVPSKLKPCAKIVGDTVGINPGSLARGRSAGTFSRIVVHPLYIPGEEDDGVCNQHGATDRVRVEVVKI